MPKNLSRPRQPFWGPLPAILDLAGGVAVQAVSEYPRRRKAGIYDISMTYSQFDDALFATHLHFNLLITCSLRVYASFTHDMFMTYS